MYDRALEMISLSGDGINEICEAVIRDRDYFSNVSTDSVSDMLAKILEAKQHKDYTLLADLYEMQLVPFICEVQELIIKREDILVYDEPSYRKNIATMRAKLDVSMLKYDADLHLSDTGSASYAAYEDERLRQKVNRNALLEEPMQPQKLLEQGYTVEFTSSGLMTLKAPLSGNEGIYMHTNMRIINEAFMLAGAWYSPDVTAYNVVGLAMGYHVGELVNLAPETRIYVYENDMNIIKLYCAFTDAGLLLCKNVFIIYDPDLSLFKGKLKHMPHSERVCVHYPSYRRIPASVAPSEVVPWSKTVEKC